MILNSGNAPVIPDPLNIYYHAHMAFFDGQISEKIIISDMAQLKPQDPVLERVTELILEKYQQKNGLLIINGIEKIALFKCYNGKLLEL